MMATTNSFVRGHFIDSETVFEMLVPRCPPYIEPIHIDNCYCDYTNRMIDHEFLSVAKTVTCRPVKKF